MQREDHGGFEHRLRVIRLECAWLSSWRHDLCSSRSRKLSIPLELTFSLFSRKTSGSIPHWNKFRGAGVSTTSVSRNRANPRDSICSSNQLSSHDPPADDAPKPCGAADGKLNAAVGALNAGCVPKPKKTRNRWSRRWSTKKTRHRRSRRRFTKKTRTTRRLQ